MGPTIGGLRSVSCGVKGSTLSKFRESVLKPVHFSASWMPVVLTVGDQYIAGSGISEVGGPSPDPQSP